MKNLVQKASMAAASAGTSLFLAAGTVLAQNQGSNTSGNGTADGGGIGNVSPGTGFATNFGNLLSNVLGIVMVIALLLVLLYLVLGGIEWITSGGDKGKTESARNKITAAVIGIIILAASYALVQLVAYILGFDNLNDALTNMPKLNDTN